MTTALTLASIRRSAGKWLAPVVLVVASLAMSITVTGFHTQALSPVDEWVYIDYLYKLPTQGIIHRGEAIGPEALELIACTGQKGNGLQGPPCQLSSVGDNVDPGLFPYAGLQSAYGYTPLYFIPTWVIAKGIQLVSGTDLLTAGRFAGTFWLVGTMLLIYALFREFKVTKTATVAIGLAFIGSPFAWWTYTYISTDIPSVGIATLLLLSARRFITGRWSGWWVVLASVAAVLFKTSNVLAVALTALYLVLHFLFEYIKSRPWKDPQALLEGVKGRGPLGLLTVAAAALLASAATQLLWQAAQTAAAIGPGPDQGISAQLTWQELLAQVANFLPNTLTSNVVSGNGYAYLIPYGLVVPLSWLCIGGVVGGLLVVKAGSSNRSIAYAVGIASVVSAPLLAVLLQVTAGAYFQLPPRYGAPILVGFLLMAGVIAGKNGFVKWVLTGYGAALVLFVIFTAHGYAR
jgi:hypothetical protein